MSVVWAACTTTSSYTWLSKPGFVTFRLYFPSDKLTNAYVPPPCVSALRKSLVVRSRSSSCAPCTTSPLGSMTVTVTVPSEPCCAQDDQAHHEVNTTTGRSSAQHKSSFGTYKAAKALHSRSNHPRKTPGARTSRPFPNPSGLRAYSHRKLRISDLANVYPMAGFCILYSIPLSTIISLTSEEAIGAHP